MKKALEAPKEVAKPAAKAAKVEKAAKKAEKLAKPLGNPEKKPDRLVEGQTLKEGDCLTAKGAGPVDYKACLQADGNFVVS